MLFLSAELINPEIEGKLSRVSISEALTRFTVTTIDTQSHSFIKG